MKEGVERWAHDQILGRPGADCIRSYLGQKVA
jgi:hypothetical protein